MVSVLFNPRKQFATRRRRILDGRVVAIGQIAILARNAQQETLGIFAKKPIKEFSDRILVRIERRRNRPSGSRMPFGISRDTPIRVGLAGPVIGLLSNRQIHKAHAKELCRFDLYWPHNVDRSLAETIGTRRIFRAGLKHSLVDSKWPAFETAFFGFDPYKVSLLGDEQIEKMMQNESLIRHLGKLKAARANALLVSEISEQNGGFGCFLAAWPITDIVALWTLLKKEGTQLGGNSGASFLRMVGKDTFMLTDDVVTALKAQGVIDKRPTAQRDLKLVQEAFNLWRANKL